MKKIILIIPYFGKLPNYFQLFLNSASKTKLVDFLLLTNDETDFTYPSNFRVIYTQFEDIRQRFFTALSKKVYLDHPYKFCDYRPLYGLIFREYISDYKFWGHCDIDVIFGDVDKFLSQINLDNYDRLFPYGHLSLYRNNDTTNRIFSENLGDTYPKVFNIDFVSKTTFPCNFDEIGINFIFRKKYKFYEENFCANLNMHYYNFVVGSGTNTKPQLLVYDSGEFFVYEKTDEFHIIKHEFMYLHMMTVNSLKKIDVHSEKYIICRDGAFDFNENEIEFYFNNYGLSDDTELQALKTKAVAEEIRHKTKQKILREFKYNKLKAFYTLYERYKGQRYLMNNPLYVY